MSHKIIFTAPTIKYYDTASLSNRDKKDFVAVSITGTQCGLMCGHCQGRMLETLYHADTPAKLLALTQRLHAEGCRGMLVTGGCNADGVLPMHNFVPALQTIKQTLAMKIAVHTKLADERLARALRDIGADTVMTDVVGDDRILSQVYHLPHRTLADVRASLELLDRHQVPLSPHVIIGLEESCPDNELRALEMLQDIRMRSLVLVVFTPLKNTQMGSQKPPAQEKVKSVMQAARKMFPQVKLFLGCAKYFGPYQRAIEEHALALRFDGVAYPSDGLMEYARGKGFDPELHYCCCALC